MLSQANLQNINSKAPLPLKGHQRLPGPRGFSNFAGHQATMLARLRLCCGAARVPAAASLVARTSAGCLRRELHASFAASQADDMPDGGDDEEGGDGRNRFKRKGRMLLDPAADRKQPGIRADPGNAEWGGMIDLLEHAAYCDGQREEDEDGFFFDMTRPEYDSECDGDPFSACYLTEDELEFPAEYVPSGYVPARINDQIYFLHAVRGYTVTRLCTKYRLSCALPLRRALRGAQAATLLPPCPPAPPPCSGARLRDHQDEADGARDDSDAALHERPRPAPHAGTAAAQAGGPPPLPACCHAPSPSCVLAVCSCTTARCTRTRRLRTLRPTSTSA